MRRCDCLCAGIVVADFVCAPVAAIPPAGALQTTEAISLAIGGCASNVAADLARLGRRAAVAGRVGNDAPGQFVRESLEHAGVDTARLTADAAAPTSSTMVINVRGEDRRFIHAIGANARFEADQGLVEAVSDARVVYVGGFGLMPGLTGPNVSRLFRAAREAGTITALDVVISDAQASRRELEQVLPWTDLFLPNADEARQLTGLDDPRRQAEAFAALGAKAVVITCGERGAVLLEENTRLRAEAFALPCVDGTGSGDAFAAGYLDGLLQDQPPGRCLEIGSALGASCVRSPGATTGVFDREELERFLSGQRLHIESWS